MIYGNLFIIYILLFIKICIIYSQNITIKAVIQASRDIEDAYYHLLVNGFNEYSKENGLGIDLKLKVITRGFTGAGIKNYGTTIDSILLTNPTKYDIYFYYSTYSQIYGEHFINLEDYLPEEYSNVFDEKILKEACSSSDNKLIGLPVYLEVTVLYSNVELLSKYNKDIPRTWDELMSTSRYIYEEEKKNNTIIKRYHSSMNENNGATAFYEFINSFRESNNSTYVELKSKTTIEALEKLKEMKDEIGEELFNEPEEPVAADILYEVERNYLFMRYYYYPHVPLYKVTALPGRKEGVSGSYIKSTNLSISKYIDEDKKKAAIEFLKYASLKEVQKKYIINNSKYSAITELYNEEEVCSVIECSVVRDAYPFLLKNNDVDYFGNDAYNKEYQKALLKYLYEDVPLSDTLKKIEDITKIYQFSLKTDDSKAGLIIFIIFLIFLTYMIVSIIFVFIKKLEHKFKFLSKDLWVLTALGSLILLSSLLTLYDDVSNLKCHLRVTLINMGFVLSITPSLIKLIINFPASNKISSWIEKNKNKYISILIVIVFTVSLNGILAISSFDIQILKTSDERNYKKCVMNSIFGNIIYYIIQVYDILVILVTLLLIYAEWNLEKTSLDVNFLSTALFMDNLSIILINIIDKIRLKDDVLYNLSLAISIIVFSISHHLFIYFIRILPVFGNKTVEEESKIIKELLNSDLYDSKNFQIFLHPIIIIAVQSKILNIIHPLLQ